MALHRDTTSRTTKGRVAGLCAALGVLVLSLVLSGCIVGTGTPTYADRSLGTVQAIQPMTADTQDGQKLEEYGLFYSTNHDDVVALDQIPGQSGFDNDAVIITNPDVKQVRVLVKYTATSGQVGTLTVDAKKLTPGTTYYYRFYTIGQESGGTVWRTLFAVGSHKTADPTLKSLKASAGTLSPSFARLKYSYTDTISRTTASSKITVVPTISGASVRMRIDAGAWSSVRNKTVSVARGHSKTLYIEVSLPDGVVATYTVKVARKS